jgi:hypothetical protein
MIKYIKPNINNHPPIIAANSFAVSLSFVANNVIKNPSGRKIREFLAQVLLLVFTKGM